MINQQHLQFRSSDQVGLSSMMFSTFFGGGSSDYATPIDTSTYFKNFQFSVADTPDPTQGNTASMKSISYFYIPTIIAILIHQFI